MKVIHNGTTYTVPQPAKPTLGELRQVCRATGMTVEEIESADANNGGDQLFAMSLITFLALHRADPDVSFSDVDNIPLEDLEFVQEPGDVEPTPGPTPARNRAARRSTAPRPAPARKPAKKTAAKR